MVLPNRIQEEEQVEGRVDGDAPKDKCQGGRGVSGPGRHFGRHQIPGVGAESESSETSQEWVVTSQQPGGPEFQGAKQTMVFNVVETSSHQRTGKCPVSRK